MCENCSTFKNKFAQISTLCMKATHHTSPQMFLSFHTKCTKLDKNVTYNLKSIEKVQIQMRTLCYDKYIAKYVANYNDEYKLTIVYPKMTNTMPSTMMNTCQI